MTSTQVIKHDCVWVFLTEHVRMQTTRYGASHLVRVIELTLALINTASFFWGSVYAALAGFPWACLLELLGLSGFFPSDIPLKLLCGINTEGSWAIKLVLDLHEGWYESQALDLYHIHSIHQWKDSWPFLSDPLLECLRAVLNLSFRRLKHLKMLCLVCSNVYEKLWVEEKSWNQIWTKSHAAATKLNCSDSILIEILYIYYTIFINIIFFSV